MISILEFIFSQTIKCEDIIENHLTQDLKNVASSEHLLRKLLKDVHHQDKGASQEKEAQNPGKKEFNVAISLIQRNSQFDDEGKFQDEMSDRLSWSRRTKKRIKPIHNTCQHMLRKL